MLWLVKRWCTGCSHAPASRVGVVWCGVRVCMVWQQRGGAAAAATVASGMGWVRRRGLKRPESLCVWHQRQHRLTVSAHRQGECPRSRITGTIALHRLLALAGARLQRSPAGAAGAAAARRPVAPSHSAPACSASMRQRPACREITQSQVALRTAHEVAPAAVAVATEVSRTAAASALCAAHGALRLVATSAAIEHGGLAGVRHDGP